MKINTFFIILLHISFLLTGLTNVQANVWLQQRWQFKEAHQAILSNDLQTFESLLAALQKQKYPISHYLRYIYFKTYLDKQENQAIERFLTQYKESPTAESLRQAWLHLLAQKKDWKTFLATYTTQTETTLRCYFLQAHLHSEQNLNHFLERAKKLWLVGQSQPKACDPLFNYLYEKEIITDKLRWQRIQLAMQANNLGLARFLARGLPQAEQQWFLRWQQMYKQPTIALKQFKSSDSAKAREIILYGLKRLAQKAADEAYEYWKAYKKEYAFTKKEDSELLRYIALRGVRQNLPQATQWLNEIAPSFIDQQVKQAQLQMALVQRNWQSIIKFIHSLSAVERKQLKWQYWLARSLEQTEQTDQAEQIFQALSKNRHYYGFLAADRLGKPYHFNPQPLKINEDLKTQLVNNKLGLKRARELYFVGLTAQARDEWQRVIDELTDEELKVAAALAHQWGWHDRAIATIAKVQNYDDLKIRFPLPFYDAVLTHAQNQDIDFAWVYAIIRQESAFQTDARSNSGALGLMQLMPATAKEFANQHNIVLSNMADLFVPDVNIRLGTAYLGYLLNRFNNNYVLATAAYNAGPTRIRRWVKRYGCLPSDIWIERIPFSQTRDYVQRVLSYTPVFEFQMVGHEQVKSMLIDAIQTEGC